MISEEKLIKKFRYIMPKRAWSENKDIYVVIDGNLVIYGQNGRFYVFKYTDDDDWNITEYPRDIYGVREWHGYGKGWRDIND